MTAAPTETKEAPQASAPQKQQEKPPVSEREWHSREELMRLVHEINEGRRCAACGGKL